RERAPVATAGPPRREHPEVRRAALHAPRLGQGIGPVGDDVVAARHEQRPVRPDRGQIDAPRARHRPHQALHGQIHHPHRVSRRPSGSIRRTPESVATATRSPQRVAATSLPAGSGRLVGGWSAAAVISLGGSAATSRWSAAPNICSGTAGSGCGHATRTRRAAETTRALPSTVYSVPSGPSVACSIAAATVSTRALPRSSASTSLLSVVSLFSL